MYLPLLWKFGLGWAAWALLANVGKDGSGCCRDTVRLLIVDDFFSGLNIYRSMSYMDGQPAFTRVHFR
jgi:hypothetical protein